MWLPPRGPDRTAPRPEPHITIPQLRTIAPKKVVGGSPPRSLLLLIKGLSRGTPRPLRKEGELFVQYREGMSDSFQSPRHGD